MIQKVVGISFNKTDNPNVEVGASIDIVHDKDNKFSSKAIAVMFQDQLLGHIGEKNNEEHEHIFKVLPLKAKVQRVAKLEEGEEFQKFKTGQITSIAVEFPMESDLDEGGLQSFNEDVRIEFRNDHLEHEYWYKGKKLIGCSSYVKKWIKEFDKDVIAPRYASSLGAKTSEVLGLWSGGGSCSADFGTVIHNAIEHYEKYKDLGAVIQAKKDLEYNKALPTHPVLRRIVCEFYELDLQEDDGYVVVEELVSNIKRGLCGRMDRVYVIDKEKKICRVKDYKINIDCEKEDSRNKFLGQFADLPNNKLSEYRLKMSFYARLLELSGWTVEGLTAFVYDGEWKAYEMDVLKLDF